MFLYLQKELPSGVYFLPNPKWVLSPKLLLIKINFVEEEEKKEVYFEGSPEPNRRLD